MLKIINKSGSLKHFYHFHSFQTRDLALQTQKLVQAKLTVQQLHQQNQVSTINYRTFNCNIFFFLTNAIDVYQKEIKTNSKRKLKDIVNFISGS